MTEPDDLERARIRAQLDADNEEIRSRTPEERDRDLMKMARQHGWKVELTDGTIYDGLAAVEAAQRRSQ